VFWSLPSIILLFRHKPHDLYVLQQELLMVIVSILQGPSSWHDMLWSFDLSIHKRLDLGKQSIWIDWEPPISSFQINKTCSYCLLPVMVTPSSGFIGWWSIGWSCWDGVFVKHFPLTIHFYLGHSKKKDHGVVVLYSISLFLCTVVISHQILCTYHETLYQWWLAAYS